MIYAGFRVSPAPGQGPALLPQVARLNKIVQKNGGKPIANFIVGVGQNSGDHIHIFAYKDWAAFGAAGEALQADQEWLAFLADVGTKVGSVSSSVLQPTPESGLQ